MAYLHQRRGVISSFGHVGAASLPDTRSKPVVPRKFGSYRIVPCPECKQPEGEPCRTGTGRTTNHSHTSRKRIAIRTAREEGIIE